MRRRAFLTAAAAAAALPAAAVAARRPRGEVGILQAALELELLATYVYDAGIKSGQLDEALVAIVEGLREHERQHAEAVGASLEALGGARPKGPESPAEADAILERRGATGRLTGATTRRRYLELVHELELLQVAGYVAAAGDLEDVRLIQTTASILTAQGAHLAAIRGLLGREPVPAALEDGRA